MDRKLNYLDLLRVLVYYYTNGRKRPKEIVLPISMYDKTYTVVENLGKFVDPGEQLEHFLFLGVRIIKGDNYSDIKVVT